MKVTAKLNNIRIAPRKARLVAKLVKGLDVKEAVAQLDVNVKKTGPFMKKLILSAVANGENNFGLDKDNLFVFDVQVGSGPTMKRWMPKAFGRAGQILKRTSKINLVLEERVEGKGRKTKEEMEKEKKKRAEEKKKQMKEMEEETRDAKEDSKKARSERIEDTRDVEKGNKSIKSKIGEKIFRRKSM